MFAAPITSRLRTLALSALLMIAATSAWAENVRVTVERATLWANPTGTGGVIGIVRRDTVLEVEAREGRWLRVVFPADPRQRGYILEQQTQPTTDAPQTASPTGGSPQPAAPAAPRRARTPPFLYLGLSAQASPLEFDVTDSAQTLLETETRRLTYEGSRRPGFEIAIGQEVRRGFIIEASVVRLQGPAATTIDARIPHPILYGQPRTLTGESTANRTETDLHLQFQYMALRGRRLQLALGAGPSFFFVNQELLDSLVYQETYPYDTVTFTDTNVKRYDARAIGGNAVVDVLFPINRRVSWQATVRYSYATPRFELGTTKVRTLAGQGHAGGGLRIAF
jgi:hypothetical protein